MMPLVSMKMKQKTAPGACSENRNATMEYQGRDRYGDRGRIRYGIIFKPVTAIAIPIATPRFFMRSAYSITLGLDQLRDAGCRLVSQFTRG
jgi:hypothetical protein